MTSQEETCRTFENHLATLLKLDDAGSGAREVEISEEAQKELLEHGARCAHCGELLRTYRTTVDLVRALPRSRAPENFLAWVREGTSASSGARRKRLKGLWLAAAAAMLISTTYLSLWSSLWSVSSSSSLPSPSSGFREAPEASFSREASQEASKDEASPLPKGSEADVEVANDEGILQSSPSSGIELALLAPCSREDLKKLESELKRAFDSPGKSGDLASRIGEERSRDLKQRLLQAPMASEAQASEEASASPPEIVLQVEPAQVSKLVAYLEGWARAKGGRIIVPASGDARSAARVTSGRMSVRVTVRDQSR